MTTFKKLYCFIKITKGMLSGSTIGKVIDNPRINEFKLLKPDIVFKTIDNVLIFDAQICLEKNMEKNKKVK